MIIIVIIVEFLSKQHVHLFSQLTAPSSLRYKYGEGETTTVVTSNVDDPSVITTDSTPTGSKFTSTLSFATPTTAEGGKYKCEFTLTDGSGPFSSDRDLIVRIVTVSPAGPIEQYSSTALDLTCTLDQSDDSVPTGNSLSGPSIVDPISVTGVDGAYVYNVPSPTTGQYECSITFEDGKSPIGVVGVAVNIIDMAKETVYTTYGEGVEVTLACQVVSTSEVGLEFVDIDTSLTDTTFTDGKTKTEYTLSVSAYAADRTFSCKVGDETSTETTTLKVLQMLEELDEQTRGNKGAVTSLTCTTDWLDDIQQPQITWFSKETADGDRSRVFSPKSVDTPDSVNNDFESVLTLTFGNSINNDIYECDVEYKDDVNGGVTYQSSTQILMNGESILCHYHTVLFIPRHTCYAIHIMLYTPCYTYSVIHFVL